MSGRLSDGFRSVLRDARRRCGGMIGVTLDGLGLVAVPKDWVDMFLRLLERDDARRSGEPNGKEQP